MDKVILMGTLKEVQTHLKIKLIHTSQIQCTLDPDVAEVHML